MASNGRLNTWAVISEHNGVEGDVGEWVLVLTPVEELVELNTDPVMQFFPGLVMIGGDGGGEALAIDRTTNEILLVPWIWGRLVLGATLTEAFQRMERGRGVRRAASDATGTRFRRLTSPQCR